MEYLDNYFLENKINKDDFDNELIKLNLDKKEVSDLLLNLDTKKYSKNKINLYHFIYWLKTNEYIDSNIECFNTKSSFPQQFFRIPLGRKNYIELQRNSRVNFVAVNLTVQDKNKEIFEYLYQFKDDLNDYFDEELFWDIRDGEITSKIGQTMFIDINNIDNWDIAIKWQLSLAEKLYVEFYPLLKDYYEA